MVHNVLHADDPPHRLALGVAIGVAVAFTPTVGFQMALIVFVAWVLGANRLVGVPLAWISNPATMAPIFYVCYRVGVAMTGYGGVGAAWWAELGRPPGGWWANVSFYWSRLLEIAVPLWAGSLVVAGVAGVATYAVVDRMIRGYRLRRWGQLVPCSEVRDQKPEARSQKSETRGRRPEVRNQKRVRRREPLSPSGL